MKIKDLYISFFLSKGHKKLNSSSIIPENDPTSLFNTAGMQPLVPYLMGKPHPLGTRLTNYQKCFRLNDIDNIGNKTHHTFFEMLGNWSLGDYFKKESIAYSFEFLTTVLNIPLDKLAVTVFRGNEFAPLDQESADFWMSHGIPADRIAYLGEADNWWGLAGFGGPCGPDSEIFYWRDSSPAPKVYDPSDSRWVEIWNNVFMQYKKEEDGTYPLLASKNVDTGMGVERVTAILEGVTDNYETSIWKPIILKIEELSNKKYHDEDIKRSMRIIADHIRAIVMISGDNALIKPSNTDQGYILRRLIRRMIRFAKKLEIDINGDFDLILAKIVIDQYGSDYPELITNQMAIMEVLNNEKVKFAKTLEKGLHEFEKIIKELKGNLLNSELAFRLYDTYGFPIELTEELASEHNLQVDSIGFKERFKEHQEKSRAGAEGKFTGGLSSSNYINIKYHTTTHLLNAALKTVLGPQVYQMGSNINDERLRFDFPSQAKLTNEELIKVEDLVNQYIKDSLVVTCEEVTKEEALKRGAESRFMDKYGELVTIYTVGNISSELCGGPHVTNTNELGHFKIIKEEASSAGVRRIKAILE